MASIYAQFGHPRGAIGWLVGDVMALKNGKRSRWVIEQLAPKEGEHVLEVGFGPGVDVARVLARVGPTGRVSGVDVSEVMVRQASRRNRDAVSAGQAILKQAGIESLPFDDSVFDAAFSVNCAQFWSDLGGGFRELFRVVRPGGRVVTAVQPMSRGATAEDSRRWLEKLRSAAEQSRWTIARAELGPTSPPVAALVATKTV